MGGRFLCRRTAKARYGFSRALKLFTLTFFFSGWVANDALAQNYVYQSQFGGPGSSNGQFVSPVGVSVDPTSDNIVVIDSFTGLAQIFDSGGGYLSQFATNALCPIGIAIDSVNRNIIVSDLCAARINVFNSSGNVVTQFGSVGTGNGQFFQPWGVAVDPSSHHIVVADFFLHVVQIFDAAGNYLGRVGLGRGSSDGQFLYPVGVAIDSASHNILVADSGNHRVQIFNSAGIYQSKFGTFGSGDGQLSGPWQIAIDPSSHNIVVTDVDNNSLQPGPSNHRVEIFSSTGVYLSKFGSFGNGNGQFVTAQGLAIDPRSHNILVTDTSTRLVQIFASNATPPPGASSVAFLPGMEASRLYTFPSSGSSEDQLWLPTSDSDMCDLKPNNDGTSALTVYTRDIVDCAAGLCEELAGSTDIYRDFMRFMDGLRSQGIIKEWKALPYDWRLDPNRIVADGVLIGDKSGFTAPFLLANQVARLANNSYTGKVTLITHSNGGLLAKRLVTALGANANLIDRIIMIAPPQLGTPKAISTLLHGDELGGLGIVLGVNVVREATETMIGAYDLLPSKAYFDRVASPVIEFSSGGNFPPADLVQWRSFYGSEIVTYDDMSHHGFRTFLLGQDFNRSQVFQGACQQAPFTEEPNVLNANLLSRVEALHNDFDTWSPPPGIKVTQVAGWGLTTMRGLLYECKDLLCQGITHERRDTTEGDGTVVVPSATALGVDTFFLDLPAYNRGLTTNRSHSDIMEVTKIQDLILALLRDESSPSIAFISKTEPTNTSNTLRLILRSPVAMDAYDSLGRHAGLIANPDATSELLAFEQLIPNSRFELFAGDVYLNLDTQDRYQINLRGLALGLFTLTLEEFNDETLISRATYTDIPVTRTTKGYLTIQHVADGSQLQLDVNGDGIIDFQLSAGTQADVGVSVAILIDVVESLGLPKGSENSLVAKLDAVVSALKRNDRQAARGTLDAFSNAVSAQANKDIAGDIASALLRIVARLAGDL